MALLGTVLLTLDHAAPAAVSANATPIAIGAPAHAMRRECRSEFCPVAHLQTRACGAVCEACDAAATQAALQAVMLLGTCAHCARCGVGGRPASRLVALGCAVALLVWRRRRACRQGLVHLCARILLASPPCGWASLSARIHGFSVRA